MNETHPCDYCGTQLDQDGNLAHSPSQRHWEGQCLDYVKAACNAKDRELNDLRTELEEAYRRLQFWQEEAERERLMREEHE